MLPQLLADAELTQIITIAVIFLALIFALFAFVVFARYFRLWIQSVTTGAGIGIFDLLGMTFRKVNPTVIVRSKIMAVQAGLGRRYRHHQQSAGGPLPGRRQCAAGDPGDHRRQQGQDHELDFKLATAIDLAGRDVLEAVQTSVYPKVIDCPARGSGPNSLDAVAKNGIQLKVKARVTVRANLEPGSSAGRRKRRSSPAWAKASSTPSVRRKPHKDGAGANPNASPRRCWPGGSIRRRRSRSSRSTSPTSTWATTSAPACRPIRPRPTCAWPGPRPRDAARWPSLEQENIASIEESRSELVAAEAEVPKAIAAAFQDGALGILDYYKLRNIQADTEMRRSISGVTTTSTPT